MIRRPILIYGHPCLTQTAQPVGAVTDDVRRLAAEMIETMYEAPGRGLAAPQVGESLRMFVVDCHWKGDVPRDPLVMIDPQILSSSATFATHEEGCLSIPGIPMQISRPAEVSVAWTGLDGTRQKRRFDGIEAVCVQHEYDHLDGILIPDRLAEAERDAVQPALAALQEQDGTA